jgi:hypothetical protein
MSCNQTAKKSNWRTVRLGEICNFNSASYSTKDKWSYVNYLDTGNIISNTISEIQRIILSKDKLPSRAKRKVRKNDIIFSTVRPNQKHYGFINKEWDNLLVSTGFVVISPIEKLSYGRYIYYFLSQNKIIDKLHSIAEQSTSTYPSIKPSDIEDLKIPLPPLEEQEAIAGVLSSLDDKIELNNKINQNLEAQAQAIFKSWFVDFEPFKDQPFIDSPLGKIPQGWKVETLRDIAEITMGQSPSGSSYNEERFGMIFYQGRTDFGYRYPKIRLYTTEPKRIASAGSILLSVRAPVGDINKTINECCIGRGLASLKSNFLSFLYYQLQQMKDSFNVFNGEGTVFGSINKESLNRIKVIIPTSEILQRFEGIGNKLDKQIENNEIQTQALTQLRDTLLPKLMSGEIDVSEVAV